MFVSHHTLKWTRTCRSHGRHPHAHTAHFLLNRHTPTGVAAYAVVPVAGMAVIDLDVAKDPATGEVLKDAPTGWDVFNREIGEYGSEDFPKTYLVGTPTGRRNGLPSAHAYYLIPPELQGRLKNAVHEKGMPVDIRCEGKGYVVGAGSHISAATTCCLTYQTASRR